MNKPHIWLDGKMIPWEQANIHLMTHTLHYGSGAFEGIRCYATQHGPAIFRLSEHVDRLLHSAAQFKEPLPWTKEMLKQAIIETISHNKLSNCYIRPLIFFGESLQVNPKKLPLRCAIIALDLQKFLARDAITVGISNIKRIPSQSVPIHNKINGFYINSIFALHETQARGFDEALLIDYDGALAEGSIANIFFVIDGILKTPTTSSILPGITRSSVLAIAQKLDIPTSEETLTIDDIQHATEAFFTGTASEITPIKAIEKIKFGPTIGNITQQIKNAYYTCTRGEDSRFQSWLTYIK